MREKTEWGKKRPHKALTADILADILRQITTEKNAKETFKRLTGKDIPPIEDEEENQ